MAADEQPVMERRPVAFTPRDGDAGDTYEKMKNENYYKRMVNETFGGNGDAYFASKSPVTGTWATIGQGRTVAESKAQADKAKAKVVARHPHAFTPPPGRRLAHRP